MGQANLIEERLKYCAHSFYVLYKRNYKFLKCQCYPLSEFLNNFFFQILRVHALTHISALIILVGVFFRNIATLAKIAQQQQ